MKKYKWNKKIFAKNMAKLCIIIGVFCLMCSTHYYKINAKVIDTNGIQTTFCDCVGDTWEWYNESGEHFTIGEKVQLKIYTPITEKATKAYDEIKAIIR